MPIYRYDSGDARPCRVGCSPRRMGVRGDTQSWLRFGVRRLPGLTPEQSSHPRRPVPYGPGSRKPVFGTDGRSVDHPGSVPPGVRTSPGALSSGVDQPRSDRTRLGLGHRSIASIRASCRSSATPVPRTGSAADPSGVQFAGARSFGLSIRGAARDNDAPPLRLSPFALHRSLAHITPVLVA